jgi:GNAT superfamily N-acetyltransferase
MLKIYPLNENSLDKFKELFTAYYSELDCDENIEHLLDEYVIADYVSGLLKIDLLDDGADCSGFIIYQIDEITNEWNFKEGWGDIREIYVTKEKRGSGFGKFMLYTAEMKLKEAGAEKYYALPFEDACGFFTACGYSDSGESSEDLDCPVYIKYPSDGCNCTK